MKRGFGPVVLLVLALSRPASANELTPAERTWIRTCVTGLTAPSARQRESAAAALSRLGPAAVAAIAPAVTLLKNDEHWAALAMALEGMGPEKALKALDVTYPAWPTAAAARRMKLVEHLLAAAKKPAAPAPAGGAGRAPAESPEDVAEKVRAILGSFEGETSYSPEDRRIGQLAALGRPAVSALLAELRQGGTSFFRSDAAAAALRRLISVDDVPTVAEMLADGHLDVAPALTRLPADAVVPALIAPLAKGFNSSELIQALEKFRDDPRVTAALVAWLESDPDGEGSSTVGAAARLLAEAGVGSALPAILVALERASSFNTVVLAKAATDLGAKRGIEVLLDVFRKHASGPSSYSRHEAGNKLNEVAGTRFYKGRFTSPGQPAEGNFDEAAPQFDAWWSEVKDKIRYDEARRAWVMP